MARVWRTINRTFSFQSVVTFLPGPSSGFYPVLASINQRKYSSGEIAALLPVNGKDFYKMKVKMVWIVYSINNKT